MSGCNTLKSAQDITLLCKLGPLDEALNAADHLHQGGITVSRDITYHLLNSCAKAKHVAAGRRLHSLMISSGLTSVAFLGDQFIRFFACCRSLLEANIVFCSVVRPSVYSWHAIISAHVMLGESRVAIELYHLIKDTGLNPNKFIFLCILKACANLGVLGHGRLLHDQIVRFSGEKDVAVGNSLVDMYAKYGSMEEACKLFDESLNRDVVSWNAIISGYVHLGNGLLALELFGKMRQDGIEPTLVTLSCIFKACGSIGAVGQGRLIHSEIIRNGLELDAVIGTTLIDMYARCWSLEEARKVFDELPNRNIVSWAAMIAGYAQFGSCLPALKLFKKMHQEDIRPDKVTFLCILKACSSLGAVGQGRAIHDQIIRTGLESHIVVGNTLIDMYARCGCLEEANKVFKNLQNKDLVSYGIMIGGYAQHGNCRLCGQYFMGMQEQGLIPDFKTFSSILAGCCHAGQVEEGHRYFKSMIENHGIAPGIEHFSCMADLLGRAGCLVEAEELLQTIPILPDITGWMSLLNACRIYYKTEMARVCFDQVMSSDSNTCAGYVLMSNIYASSHMWDDVHKIQQLRTSANSWKEPGKAWIEYSDKVHEFAVTDACSSQSDAVLAKSNRFKLLMKENGYVPELTLVL